MCVCVRERESESESDSMEGECEHVSVALVRPNLTLATGQLVERVEVDGKVTHSHTHFHTH